LIWQRPWGSRTFQVRAVDIDHLEAAGRFLPAIYLAFNLDGRRLHCWSAWYVRSRSNQLLMSYVWEAEMSKKVKLREGDGLVVPIDGINRVLKGVTTLHRHHRHFGRGSPPS
jgi:hypothetical protein